LKEFQTDYKTAENASMYSCNRDVEPEHWAKFRDAINATGRPMVFSIIAQGQKESWIWGNATGTILPGCLESLSYPDTVCRESVANNT
jgi:hypothetical protein